MTEARQAGFFLRLSDAIGTKRGLKPFRLHQMVATIRKEGITMDHPQIEQIMKSGYPKGVEETMLDATGDTIEAGDLYFKFPNGDMVLAENLGEYVLSDLDAEEIEA